MPVNLRGNLSLLSITQPTQTPVKRKTSITKSITLQINERATAPASIAPIAMQALMAMVTERICLIPNLEDLFESLSLLTEPGMEVASGVGLNEVEFEPVIFL